MSWCFAGQKPHQALVPVEEQYQGDNLDGSKKISHTAGKNLLQDCCTSFDVPADNRKQPKNSGKGEKCRYKNKARMALTEGRVRRDIGRNSSL